MKKDKINLKEEIEMAEKVLDMKKNVHDLATEYPEVIDIMIELDLRISLIQLLLIPWEG